MRVLALIGYLLIAGFASWLLGMALYTIITYATTNKHAQKAVAACQVEVAEKL